MSIVTKQTNDYIENIIFPFMGNDKMSRMIISMPIRNFGIGVAIDVRFSVMPQSRFPAHWQAGKQQKGLKFYFAA